MANRHLSRSIAMQSLYEWDFWGRDKNKLQEIVERNTKEFGPGMEEVDFVWRLVNGVIENIDKIDEIISKAAPQWPLEQITIVEDRKSVV